MTGSDIAASIGIIIVVMTLYVKHKPAPSIAGESSVPTTVHTDFIAAKDHADGDLTMSWSSTDQDGTVHNHVAHADVRHGRVYQSPAQTIESDAAGLKLHYDRTVSLVDPYLLDIGTVAGAAGLSGGGRFQVGLRYSPVRLLYGTVAPDALLTQDTVGLGVSFYLPADYYPNASHWGIEVGRLVPTRHGTKPANFVGVAFSTYDP